MTSLPDPRLKFIDFDARRDPKTERWCIMCQKDLKPGTKVRSIRVLDIDGGPYSVHPDDEAALDGNSAFLARSNVRDLGQCLIGLDCAKRHGTEWSKP
jgi:hypothetical protein